MGRRITRKQLKGDEFVSAVDVGINWLSGNWKPLVGAVGALVVVAGLWWAGNVISGARTEKASYLLHQALATYEGSAGEAGQQPVGDPAAAEPQFLEVVDRFGGTDQAEIARLYLTRIQLSRGEDDSARQTLLQLVERNRENALGQLAMFDLVRLRIASGQAAEVAKDLEAMVVGSLPGLPRDAALYELGVLYLEEHDLERAREYLQKLVDEFPESPYTPSAREHLQGL